jgi:hypothetical protein
MGPFIVWAPFRALPLYAALMPELSSRTLRKVNFLFPASAFFIFETPPENLYRGGRID